MTIRYELAKPSRFGPLPEGRVFNAFGPANLHIGKLLETKDGKWVPVLFTFHSTRPSIKKDACDEIEDAKAVVADEFRKFSGR